MKEIQIRNSTEDFLDFSLQAGETIHSVPPISASGPHKYSTKKKSCTTKAVCRPK